MYKQTPCCDVVLVRQLPDILDLTRVVIQYTLL